jgi:hypothetical protein
MLQISALVLALALALLKVSASNLGQWERGFTGDL